MTKPEFENVLYRLACRGLEMPATAFIALKAHLALPELAKFVALELWINHYPECIETRELRQQLVNLAEVGIFLWD